MYLKIIGKLNVWKKMTNQDTEIRLKKAQERLKRTITMLETRLENTAEASRQSQHMAAEIEAIKKQRAA